MADKLSFELIERLKKIAAARTTDDRDWLDDKMDDDAYGSSAKDAYSNGYDDGEIYLARTVLVDMGIKF
jgi:hypothetical protein